MLETGGPVRIVLRGGGVIQLDFTWDFGQLGRYSQAVLTRGTLLGY